MILTMFQGIKIVIHWIWHKVVPPITGIAVVLFIVGLIGYTIYDESNSRRSYLITVDHQEQMLYRNRSKVCAANVVFAVDEHGQQHEFFVSALLRESIQNNKKYSVDAEWCISGKRYMITKATLIDDNWKWLK